MKPTKLLALFAIGFCGLPQIGETAPLRPLKIHVQKWQRQLRAAVTQDRIGKN